MAHGYIICGKGNIARETEKAIALDFDKGYIWLPKSLINVEYNEGDGQTVYVHMPVWLAKKNGLFGYDCFGRAIFQITD